MLTRQRRHHLLAAVIVALLLVLTGCGNQGNASPSSVSSAPAPAARPTAIRARIVNDLQTLDPALLGDPSGHAIAYLIYNGLVKYAPGSLEVAPDLATKWEISDDGKVYTFHLRQGVKWQKGYGELTADDVVYSINRIKNPATKSRFKNDLDIIDKVETVDKSTVRFTLKQPFSPFLSSILAFRPGWIVNKKAVEEKGATYGIDPIGTGPYLFDHWTRGSEVVLKKNPDFFKPATIDTVTFKLIQEDSVAELALTSGDLDIGYFYDGDSAKRLKQNSSALQVKELPGYRTQWAAFNLDRPAVKDVRVRQAIIYAIDKKAAAQAVYQGLAEVVSSLFNPNIPGYINPDPFPYNPDKARALLKDAGHPDGIHIKVLVQPNVQWPDLATVLQDQWKKVGIDAEIIVRERAVYDKLAPQGDYDIHAENIARADAFQFAAFVFGPNNPFPNTHHYSSADAIINAAARATDETRQNDLWKQLQEKIIVQDVVGFGMTNVHFVLASRKGIKGVDSMYQDSFPIEQMSMP